MKRKDMKNLVEQLGGKKQAREMKKEEMKKFLESHKGVVDEYIMVNESYSFNQEEIEYLIHLSDIHIRAGERKQEYLEVFEQVYTFIENSGIGEKSFVVITGDFYHTKEYYLPDEYNLGQIFLTRLSELTKGVIIIAGNHDISSKNIQRMDIISALHLKLNKEKIYYLKYSGAYKIGKNLVFVVSSSFIDGKFISRDKVKVEDGMKVICLYHGMINGAVFDNNYIVQEARGLELFNGFDLTLLGDIHKHQYLGKDKRIAYAGSLIQQNFKETIDNHGLILWNLVDNSSQFVPIKNNYGFVKVEIRKNDKIKFEVLDNIPPKPSFQYNIYDGLSKKSYWDLLKEFESKYCVQKRAIMPCFQVQSIAKEITEKSKVNVLDILRELLKTKVSSIENIEMLVRYYRTLVENEITGGDKNSHYWELKEVRFKNILSYGGDKTNVINFEDKRGALSISGKNTLGKTNILRLILYALFDYTDASIKDLINTHYDSGFVEVQIISGNSKYIIHKKLRKRKERRIITGRSEISIWETNLITGQETNITHDNQNPKAENRNWFNSVFGNYENFITQNVSSISYSRNFFHLKPTEKVNELKNTFNLYKYEVIAKAVKDENDEINKLIKNLEWELRSKKSNIDAYSDGKDENELLLQIKEIDKNIEDLKIKKEKSETYLRKEEEIINNLRKQKEEVIRETKGYDENELNKLEKIWKGKSENDNNSEIEFLRKKDIVLNELNLIKDIEQVDNIEEAQKLIDNYSKKIKNIKFELNTKDKSIEELYEKYKKIKRVDGLLHYHNEEIVRRKIKEIGNTNEVKNLKNRINTWICIYTKGDLLADLCLDAKVIMDNVLRMIENDKFTRFSEQKKLEDNLIALEKQAYANVIYQKLIDEIRNGIKKKELCEELKRIEENDRKKELKRYNELLKMKEMIKNGNEIELKIMEKEKLIIEVRDELIEFAKQIAVIEKEKEKLNETLKRVNKDYAKLMNIENKLNEFKKKRDLFEIFENVIGSKGLCLELIKKKCEYLEKYINDILGKFTQYQIKIEGKSSNYSNIIIRIIKDDEEISINGISGFETFMLNIVFKLGLSHCNEIYKNNLFFIDEGLDCLDESNFERLSELIDVIKEEYCNIILISHREGIDQFADEKLSIIKEGKSSKIV